LGREGTGKGVGTGREKWKGYRRRDGWVEEGRVEGWELAGEGRRWGRERTTFGGDFF